MAAKKASTKKNLETKIAELEVKLSKLAAQLEAPAPKPAEVKPAETKPAETKPAETKPAEVKPAETKPAEVKPAETKPKSTLPKGSTQQSSSSSNAGKSKKQSLDDYEADYMKRMTDEQKEHEELMRAAAELSTKRQSESKPSDSPSKKGALPKGF